MTCVKADELRRLAREFRAKASETAMGEYIAMMMRSAQELEELADSLDKTGPINRPILTQFARR